MYNKLFTTILDSSVWLESHPTRIVWMTFLAAMDEEGFCRFGSVGNVASRARVTEDQASEAIRIFMAPDTKNPEQENAGRRIEQGDGGFFVLNAGKYQELATRKIAKERNRQRQQRFREAQKAKATLSGNAALTPRNAPVTPSDTDTDALPEGPYLPSVDTPLEKSPNPNGGKQLERPENDRDNASDSVSSEKGHGMPTGKQTPLERAPGPKPRKPAGMVKPLSVEVSDLMLSYSEIYAKRADKKRRGAVPMSRTAATDQAEEFMDYFTSNGWAIGKAGKPMKDWKSTVKRWVRNYYERRMTPEGEDVTNESNFFNC